MTEKRAGIKYEEEFRPWIHQKQYIPGFYTDQNIIIGMILSEARDREVLESKKKFVF